MLAALMCANLIWAHAVQATESAKKLSPAASASLHASLSLAYEKLPDMQRAIEQKSLEEQVLIASNALPQTIENTQKQMWALLTRLNKAQLIEVRGESIDANMQGWVDLALAYQANANTPNLAISNLAISNLTNWQKSYPDHSAQAFSGVLISAWLAKVHEAASVQSSAHLIAKVALLLPFDLDAFKASAQALQIGFNASAALNNNAIGIKTYAITQQAADFAKAYDLAVSEGANYVVTAFAPRPTQPLSIPTLMLDESADAVAVVEFSDVKNSDVKYRDVKNSLTKNLTTFSLSLNDDAALLAKTAYDFGLQKALIISDDSALASSLTQAFNAAWQNISGQSTKQISIAENFDLTDLKTQTNVQINTQQIDLILIAGDAAFARKVRPYLDIATPTFGFYPVYSGEQYKALDTPLNAIRFVDMPWMLNAENFKAYANAANTLAQSSLQRWFAFGADAYQILNAIILNTSAPAATSAVKLNGLTGTLYLDENGLVSREPALGRFTNAGVVLEK